MRLWQAKSIGLDQQTGEAAGEVLHLTRFRPITEPSNADKFSRRRFAVFCCNLKLLNPVQEREGSVWRRSSSAANRRN
jgi:hypothetical protein